MIMTNHSNYEATKALLKEKKYFGGKKENFIIFTQGVLPQVDLDGKIILKKTSEIQMSPTGSGALFESICSN